MSALTALLVFLISFALVAVLFRMPVSFALGTSSLLVLAYAGFQLVTVPQFAFSGLDSFALLAIPFYIFAGVIMEYSGISKMLIDWVKSFVGRVRGATGIITTCACMAFGVLTGSAMATISAIGKMMVPELEKEGYPHGYSSALLAATCFLGILIPPSVPGIMLRWPPEPRSPPYGCPPSALLLFLPLAILSSTISESAATKPGRKKLNFIPQPNCWRLESPLFTPSPLC